MSRRIRLMLLLTVVGVAGALLLAPAQAQVRPGGGVGGRPGGIAGQPPGGIGGGINGQPNIGGINGQPGNIAGQPGFQGNGFGGAIGNPPQMPKIGPPQYEWVCSGCGAVVGRGPFKPALSSCPNCRAKFRNGPGAGVDFNQGALFNPPAGDVPDNPPGDGWMPPGQKVPDNAGQNFPANNNNAADAAARSAVRRMFLVVGVIALGGMLVIVAVIVGIVVLVSRSGSTASAPRQSSRTRVYHDV
jgi:hypothetical protein